MDVTNQAEDKDSRIMREAKRRVGLKMGFLTHLLVFVLVNVGLFVLNGWTGGHRWHQFPLYGWGLGLAIHGIVTLIALQGSGMQERMLEREVEALRRKQRGG